MGNLRTVAEASGVGAVLRRTPRSRVAVAFPPRGAEDARHSAAEGDGEFNDAAQERLGSTRDVRGSSEESGPARRRHARLGFDDGARGTRRAELGQWPGGG